MDIKKNYVFDIITRSRAGNLTLGQFRKLDTEVRNFSAIVVEEISRRIFFSNDKWSVILNDLVYQILCKTIFIDLSQTDPVSISIDNFTIQNIYDMRTTDIVYDIGTINYSYRGVPSSLYDICLSIPLYFFEYEEKGELQFIPYSMNYKHFQKWNDEQLPILNSILNKSISLCLEYLESSI